MVLRVRDLEIGWAKAQELRAAIQALRARGRRVIAYLETGKLGANVEYYVAVAADEVRAAPATRSPMIGLAAEYVFLGGFWERFGVDVEVERVGEYKGAAETLSERKMSAANREMANSLLDSIDAQFVAGIAEGRRLAPEAVRRAIDDAPISPEQLKKPGLIDGIQFWDELVDELGGAGKARRGEGLRARRPEARRLRADRALRADLRQRQRGGRAAARRRARARRSSPRTPSARRSPMRRRTPASRPSSSGSTAPAARRWRPIRSGARRARRGRRASPLIVSCSDLAASAAYYAAAGADAIVALPGSLTGSIGVFVLRPVLRGLLEKLDIGVESLTRGGYASLLLASEPLSERTRAWLHAEVVSIYDLFLSRVSEGRDLTVEQVDAVARGRVWTGEQAASNGLVDEIGGLRVAVRRALQQLELDPDSDVALVPYPAPVSLAEQLDETLRNLTAAGRSAGRRAAPRRALARSDPGGSAGAVAALHSHDPLTRPAGGRRCTWRSSST